MPSEQALGIAARCWCDDETEKITMDTARAVAFAKQLDILLGYRELLKKYINFVGFNEGTDFLPHGGVTEGCNDITDKEMAELVKLSEEDAAERKESRSSALVKTQ